MEAATKILSKLLPNEAGTFTLMTIESKRRNEALPVKKPEKPYSMVSGAWSGRVATCLEIGMD
jgi:hypothetical protein